MNISDLEIESRILQSIEDLQDITITEKVFKNGIVEAGNNFCSEASRFILRYRQNGEEREKSFFLKIPYNVGHYDLLKRANFYSKEVRMYETVLPVFKSSLPAGCGSLCPEFYGTDGRDALILEDLSRFGYRMQERREQLDFEHCAIALKVLAKFHAVSVWVRETRPEVLDGVTEEVFLTSAGLSSEEFQQFGATIQERVLKVVSRANPTYAKEHPQAVSFLQDNLLVLAKDKLKPDANSFNVLNHGDFWTNNIMFAYDPFDMVVDAKCVDFQICRWGSPALDILYFAMNSMRVDVFERYFDILLETYANALNATLKYLNCDARLTVDDLRRSIDEKYEYLMYVMLVVLPLILLDPEKQEHGNLIDEKFLEEERYVRVSQFWISHFIEKGVFSKYEPKAIAAGTYNRKLEAENDRRI